MARARKKKQLSFDEEIELQLEELAELEAERGAAKAELEEAKSAFDAADKTYAKLENQIKTAVVDRRAEVLAQTEGKKEWRLPAATIRLKETEAIVYPDSEDGKKPEDVLMALIRKRVAAIQKANFAEAEKAVRISRLQALIREKVTHSPDKTAIKKLPADELAGIGCRREDVWSASIELKEEVD